MLGDDCLVCLGVAQGIPVTSEIIYSLEAHTGMGLLLQLRVLVHRFL